MKMKTKILGPSCKLKDADKFRCLLSNPTYEKCEIKDKDITLYTYIHTELSAFCEENLSCHIFNSDGELTTQDIYKGVGQYVLSWICKGSSLYIPFSVNDYDLTPVTGKQHENSINITIFYKWRYSNGDLSI